MVCIVRRILSLTRLLSSSARSKGAGKAKISSKSSIWIVLISALVKCGSVNMSRNWSSPTQGPEKKPLIGPSSEARNGFHSWNAMTLAISGR